MAQRKARGTPGDPDEQALRDQEVLRANRELAAYFKGQRTEREARAALKTIKAFVRDRERLDVASRPPLPGVGARKTTGAPARRKATGDRDERRRRKAHRTLKRPAPKRVAPVLPLREAAESPPESSDEHSPE